MGVLDEHEWMFFPEEADVVGEDAVYHASAFSFGVVVHVDFAFDLHHLLALLYELLHVVEALLSSYLVEDGAEEEL